jgi:hypothetical protein
LIKGRSAICPRIHISNITNCYNNKIPRLPFSRNQNSKPLFPSPFFYTNLPSSQFSPPFSLKFSLYTSLRFLDRTVTNHLPLMTLMTPPPLDVTTKSPTILPLFFLPIFFTSISILNQQGLVFLNFVKFKCLISNPCCPWLVL